MSHRRPLAVLFAVFILAGSGSVALATGPDTMSATPAPLLWAGRVVDRQGQPAPARVTAFIRPPASAIPAAGEGAAAPASIPLTSAQTGQDGRFELRAEAPAVPEEYRPDGWLHVMLFSEGADGSWSIATDSVRYVPAGGALARPAWLSTLEAAERAERLRSSGGSRARVMAAMDRLGAEDQASGYERPGVIQLGEPKAQASVAQPYWKGPGDPYVGCTARHVESRQDAMRTISDIDVGPHWSYVINYVDTGTTSWDVGYEQSGGNWKVAGTSSFSNRSGRGFDAEYGPYPARFREAYQVELVHAKVLWQCGSRTSPGPFYVRTVEPERWTGGTYNQYDPVVPCNPKFKRPVAGNTYGWRDEGKTSKYSASAAVYGFSGQAAVTYTKSIKLGWMNHLEHPRRVCGESGNPYEGRTRVAAMDE